MRDRDDTLSYFGEFLAFAGLSLFIIFYIPEAYRFLPAKVAAGWDGER